jgi:hypothetical protein
MKTKIIILIAIVAIMFMEYLILDFTFQPKIVTKIKIKEKIKKEVKEIEKNRYYIYEDKLQVISLLIYDNKFAQILVTPKDFNTPLAFIFNSHNLTVFYTIKDYNNSLYLTGELDTIKEFKKIDNVTLLLVNDDLKFERTNLNNIYKKIDRANLLYKSTTPGY